MHELFRRLFFDFFENSTDPSAVEKTKKRANVPPTRRIDGNTGYANDEWQRLFKTACRQLGDEAVITHGSRCMKRGDSECEIRIIWEDTFES